MLQSQKKLDFSLDAPRLIGDDTTPGYIDKALDVDSTISTAWLGLISDMVSSEVDVLPSGANPEIVDFVRELLFKRADRRFADYHTDLLSALLYGCAPAEVTLRFAEGKWWLKDLAFIHPRHFDFSTCKKEPGQWWVTGKCYVDHKPVNVGAPGSGDPVVWWPIYGKGLLGSSLLRPIIEVHNEKAEVIEQRRVALQKSIQGSLIATTGEPTAMLPDELTKDQLQDIADELANCANGTDNAVALPPQVKLVQPIYPASDSISKSIEAENHCDLSILTAFGSQHLARGLLSSYGSEGSGTTDARAQQALRGYFFQWVARQFQDLIDWLVDLNFGPQGHYPELAVISSAPQTPEGLVRAVVQLSGAGGVRLTENDENYLRRMLRLPAYGGQELPSRLRASIQGYYNETTSLDTRERSEEYERAKQIRREK